MGYYPSALNADGTVVSVGIVYSDRPAFGPRAGLPVERRLLDAAGLAIDGTPENDGGGDSLGVGAERRRFGARRGRQPGRRRRRRQRGRGARVRVETGAWAHIATVGGEQASETLGATV